MKKLFIDLENTVIESWHNPKPLLHKIKFIRKFAQENRIKEVTIFSMALENEIDEVNIKKGLHQNLEDLLELKINLLLLDTVFDIVLKKNHIHAEKSEIRDIFPFNLKEQLFTEFTKICGADNEEWILIDDIVSDSEILFKKNNLKITFINI